MINSIKNVVVLGASGTVGSLTGGIIAQAGIKVHFLSRSSANAKRGLKKAIDQARSEVISRHIECGDYEHMLESALSEADLIIESLSEDLEIKRAMYQQVERYRRPETIIGTTTSSLSLSALSEGMSEGFRKHFMSTHFYNPPGKMIACEIASTDDTDPAVYEFVKGFLRDVLGREIIAVNNIPGFAGNRIAFVLFNYITCLAQEHGVEMMDYLIGPYTGRLMPPLATIDLVGLDIHKAIIRSLQDNTNDYMHDSLKLPDYIDTMLNGGLLGRKSGSGFYKRLESGKRMFYDPTSNEYVPGISPHVLFVEKARGLIHLGMYKQAFEVIKSAKGPEADIVKDILCMYVSYSYSLIGEVTKAEDGIMGIDDVMSYGFNWAPPSVIVKVLGGKGVVCQMLSERGFLVPQSLSDEVETDNEIVGSGKYFVS